MQINYKGKLVARLSKTTSNIKQLCIDIRKAFLPNTMLKLKEQTSARAKDYILVADTYEISHFMFLTQTEHGVYFRIFNYIQRSPTYTFKIVEYTLINQLPNINCANNTTLNSKSDPYIIMDQSVKLDFINTHNDIENVERVIYVTKQDDLYYFRHYFVRKSDGENVRVRLIEIGPRITMELYKIEDGIMGGDIIYNKYVTKTKEEIENNKKKIREKEDLRLQRRQEQEENVKRKMKMNSIEQNQEYSDESTSDDRKYKKVMKN